MTDLLLTEDPDELLWRIQGLSRQDAENALYILIRDLQLSGSAREVIRRLADDD